MYSCLFTLVVCTSCVCVYTIISCSCSECFQGGDLLLCSEQSCTRGYHLECLVPVLSGVPVDDWACPVCRPGDRAVPADCGSVEDHDHAYSPGCRPWSGVPTKRRRRHRKKAGINGPKTRLHSKTVKLDRNRSPFAALPSMAGNCGILLTAKLV